MRSKNLKLKMKDRLQRKQFLKKCNISWIVFVYVFNYYNEYNDRLSMKSKREKENLFVYLPITTVNKI
jgi:hypothetical protein